MFSGGIKRDQWHDRKVIFDKVQKFEQSRAS